MALSLLTLASPSWAQSGVPDQIGPSDSVFLNAAPSSLVWQQQIRTGIGGQLEGITVTMVGSVGASVTIRVRAGAAWNSSTELFSGTATKVTPDQEDVFVDMTGANIWLGTDDVFVLEIQGTDSGNVTMRGSHPAGYPEPLYLNAGPPSISAMGFTTYVITCNHNGVVEGFEQCDDGNSTAGDGCHECMLEYCGNGTTDAGEGCDDGNTSSGDGCSSDCMSDESCGNDVIDTAVGEACDDGNTTDGDGCQGDCSLPGCGDGIVDAGEACDDGNQSDGDGCSATCTSDESCGNSVVDGAVGEQCDDGNTTDGDGCQGDCSLPGCGDGIVDAGEACDDGNQSDGDGCSATCTSDESCGNSVVDGAIGEQCDDGNTATGDGCGASCMLEICGNGIADPDEACDDGNTLNGDGCSSDCGSDETCGNSVLDVAAGEACDDGNDVDGDGCQANCSLPSCGDGFVEAGEACDDGNSVDGDGCNAACTSDESCGNGVVDQDEFCDEASANSAEGPCGLDCQVVAGSGAGGGGGSAGGSAAAVSDEDDSGCGCVLVGSKDRDARWWLAALALAWVITGSRRRRAAG